MFLLFLASLILLPLEYKSRLFCCSCCLSFFLLVFCCLLLQSRLFFCLLLHLCFPLLFFPLLLLFFKPLRFLLGLNLSLYLFFFVLLLILQLLLLPESLLSFLFFKCGNPCSFGFSFVSSSLSLFLHGVPLFLLFCESGVHMGLFLLLHHLIDCFSLLVSLFFLYLSDSIKFCFLLGLLCCFLGFDDSLLLFSLINLLQLQL